METPLSSRRITRSQAHAIVDENSRIPMSSKVENEESKQSALKSRHNANGGKHQEREKSALFDITNGSPIVGLAMGSLRTPSSTCSKKRMMVQSKQATTPGSGESLLRGQVKNLLQKVEEEGRICFQHSHKRFAVLAPTPTNTPQLYDFSTNNNAFVVSPVAENFSFCQMLDEIICEPNEEEKKDVITRSLLMDFLDSSECNSVVTDGSSVWSVEVNASTSEEYKDEEDGNDEGVDELCEGMSKVSLNKHTRFVYNSDGELLLD